MTKNNFFPPFHIFDLKKIVQNKNCQNCQKKIYPIKSKFFSLSNKKNPTNQSKDF